MRKGARQGGPAGRLGPPVRDGMQGGRRQLHAVQRLLVCSPPAIDHRAGMAQRHTWAGPAHSPKPACRSATPACSQTNGHVQPAAGTINRRTLPSVAAAVLSPSTSRASITFSGFTSAQQSGRSRRLSEQRQKTSPHSPDSLLQQNLSWQTTCMASSASAWLQPRHATSSSRPHLSL